MVKVEKSTVIDAPVDRVWSVLRDFNGHDRWHPAVRESRIEERRSGDMVGAVRRFRLTDGAVLRERLLTLLRRREDVLVLPAGYADSAAELRRPRRAAPRDRRRAHVLALVVGVRHPARTGAQARHPGRRGHLHAGVRRDPPTPRGVSGRSVPAPRIVVAPPPPQPRPASLSRFSRRRSSAVCPRSYAGDSTSSACVTEMPTKHCMWGT